MPFKQLLQDLTSQAFTIIDDLAEEVTYHHVAPGNPVYDTETGKVLSRLGEFQEVVKAVIQPKDSSKQSEDQPTEKEFGGEIVVLIPGTALSIPPATNDRIIRSNGEVFIVGFPKTDPAGALWKLDVQRIGGGIPQP